MNDESFAGKVTRLGALSDPVRRALYRFVAAQPGSVSREQAAEGVHVPRHTARHHLDRLVEEGLLVTEFRRLTGRTGPGAGRPAKLYRRAEAELAVSVPQRSYDLAGRVLADAISRALSGTPMARAVEQAATDAGTRVAESADREEPRLSPLRRLARVLAPHGFEPQVEAAQAQDTRAQDTRSQDTRAAPSLVLGNCPFDRLAAEHTALICGMNRSFVDAVADGIGCADLRAELDPAPGRCCVRVLDPGVADRAAAPDAP